MEYGKNAPDTIRYLDAAGGQAASHKHESFRALRAAPGQRLLDVGCGTGDDVQALAEQVGPGGEVVGVDQDAALLEEARRRADSAPLPVRFVQGDASALPFEDASFDGSRSERVFQHLTDPLHALREMKRVTCAGGRVVVLDVDWDTLAVHSRHPDVTRKVVHFACDRQTRGQVGRELRALFKQAGFEEVQCEAHAGGLTDWALANGLLGLEGSAAKACEEGCLSPKERDEWLDDLRAKAAADAFFAAITTFCASGTRP